MNLKVYLIFHLSILHCLFQDFFNLEFDKIFIIPEIKNLFLLSNNFTPKLCLKYPPNNYHPPSPHRTPLKCFDVFEHKKE